MNTVDEVGASWTSVWSLIIKSQTSSTVIRRSFFTQRVVKLWISLQYGTMEAQLLSISKTEVDAVLDIKGIER